MSREQEKRSISPILLRYLLSEETRRRYLGGYRNIKITEQDDDERYYAFDATSKDGRTELKTDVFLSGTARPFFVRQRSTKSYPSGNFRNVHVTSYFDLETTIQIRELWGSEHYDQYNPHILEYLFSVRSHLQKQRDGIHWIYETDGEIGSIEVHPNPALKITFFYASSPEDCMTSLDDPDSPKTNYSAAINHNGGNVLVTVKSEDGITITGECADKVDPLLYHLRLNEDGRRWKNIFVDNPTRFSFSETVKGNEDHSE